MVAVENVYSASNASNLNVQSVTVPGVQVPASGRVLVAMVAFNNDNYETVSNVRLNNSAATPFTRIGSDAITDDDGNVGIWYLSDPPAGTHTVTANLSAALGTGDDLFTVAVAVLEGVRLTNPHRNDGASIATQTVAPIEEMNVTTQDGDLVLAAGFKENNIEEGFNLRVGGTTVMLWREDGTGTYGDTGMGALKVATGTTTTIEWIQDPGDQFAARAVPFVPANGEWPPPAVTATLMSEPYPGASGDVADGPAIIPDPDDPSNSVVIVTDKADTDGGSVGGLYVLDMDGEILSSQTGFAANSVDWRDTTGLSGWDGRILVMTCDRKSGSFGLRFYWFSRATRALTLASTASLSYEPYGTCLGVVGGNLYAYVSERGSDDTSPRNMRQYQLTRSGDSVSIGSPVRTVGVDSVAEGMIVDDDNGHWFVSEENVGLFRYSAASNGGSSRTAVDLVSRGRLVQDVEDVGIADTADGKKLLVSSQGNNTYLVYDLATLAFEQQFRVMRPGGSVQVAGTDGLDVCIANLGPTFPNGLIVVHDEGPDPSRFAFVDAALVFGEIESAITGTIESALPAFTQAAEGTVAPPQFTGEVASTLPAFTQSAEGEVTAPEFTGTAASVLPAFTQAADGDVSAPEFTGQISSTLPAFTQAAEGTSAPPQFDGEITSAMPAFTQSVEGDVAPPEFSGEISSTLPAFTQGADGTVDHPGTSGQMASVLPAFMQAAEGDVSAPVLEGEIVSTLPPFTQSAEGDVAAPGFVGTVASVLPAFTQSAEGDVVSPGVTGQIASTLPAFSQFAEGTVTAPPITGEIASVLPAFTQKALGPDTDLCWPSMTLIEDWVGSTLVPEGTAMILVEDGCRP